MTTKFVDSITMSGFQKQQLKNGAQRTSKNLGCWC